MELCEYYNKYWKLEHKECGASATYTVVTCEADGSGCEAYLLCGVHTQHVYDSYKPDVLVEEIRRATHPTS